MTTTSDEFRPWELKNQTQDDVSDPQKGGQRQTAWGKIRYLAGGRLISQEEYQAMLLANEAYEMIRTARYQMAVTILKKALATYPNLASAHTNIGLALSRLGEITQAEDHLKEAIAIDPARSAPWINLASCFQLNGQLRESVATYREYLRRFPSELLAAKARDLVKHLQEECVHQTAVEKALSTAKESGKNDYFQYATYGGATRWGSDHKPIKVYISSGSGIPDFKPEYAGLFKDSFKQWSSACQDVIAFELVNSADKSDIDCQWTNDTSKVSTPTEGGETRISSASTKGIQHATITVLTCDPSPDSPLSQNQVRAVCLHEIGHALGLVGHSPRPQDIMYCSIPPADAKVALSPRDVSTLQRLYSSEATIGLKTWLPGGTTSSKSQALLKRMTDIATNRRNLTSLRQAGNDAAAKGG